ncbi:MAG: FIST N-terminal domain-containing protein [Chthoniobacterales bacterium]
MASSSLSVFFEGPYSESGTHEAAAKIREGLPGPATIVFAFVTPDYLPVLDDFIDTIRVDGHVAEVVGCTASNLIAGGTETQNEPGFSLVALHSPGTTTRVLDLSTDRIASSVGPDSWREAAADMTGWVVLGNPYGFAADDWLDEWNVVAPGVPTVGGVASGGDNESEIAVFHNSELQSAAVAVGFAGALELLPAVSQGCRPIGEALPVTRAEDNIVFALGSRPAYQALESAFESLSETERSHAQGNLFAGLANNEYVEEFRSGDFLIRSIIGADPNSGAVVIGGVPRLGQTLQYQLRDSAAADADLRDVLAEFPRRHETPVASLVFSCLGRASKFFSDANHDAALVQKHLQSHHSAGFFGNGEIGPVGGRNCVHAYTASCAVFYDRHV